jgi:F420-dependent oxidoreductase-like protein
MRISLYLSDIPGGLPDITERVRVAERAGLDGVFFPQLTSLDALTVTGLAGAQVPRIGLGTAVVRTYATHPLALAGQALTVQAAIGNRLTLGVGPSHRQVIEGQYGLSYERPARHVREYLEALRPLLRGEPVDYHGETITAVGQVDVPGTTPPAVLVSALGPMMLRIAGELADGTVTVWTGAEVLGEHIVPAVTESAARAGRAAPRVVATIMVSVTADPARVREAVAARFGAAGQLASYRRLLDLQGKSGPEETVIAGDESLVADVVRQFAEAGVTELVAGPVGTDAEQARTMQTLAALRR